MCSKSEMLEEQLYRIGLVFLVVGSVGIFIYMKILVPNLPPMPCVLHQLTGLYCPGCGGTRAVEALLHGRFLHSLWYHPLVLYTIIIFGGFMLTQTMERIPVLHFRGWKFHEWYLYGALVIVVINFIVKNMLLICFHITL